MAGHLMRSMPWLAFIVGSVLAAPLNAQGVLPDPTRPPPGFAEEGAVPVEAVSGPVLESVMIPRKGRPVAIISGRMVRLGETWGSDRLIRLSEHEAVLEGASGGVHLRLTPDVEKTPIVGKKMYRTPLLVPGRSTP